MKRWACYFNKLLVPVMLVAHISNAQNYLTNKKSGMFQTNPIPLQYKVITVTRPGVNRDPGMPQTPDSLKWVCNTATLIYGQKDVVLIDCFLTIEQNNHLIDSIVTLGKSLKYIYITHPHGDHFFGLKQLLDRFPTAKAITSAGCAAQIPALIQPDIIRTFWETRFPGQIPKEFAIPEALSTDTFSVEGNTFHVLEDGFTDTHHSTSIWVPAVKLIVAGDVVYNGIHPFLNETTPATRNEWIKALDHLAALSPVAVVAGHKNPALPDSPDNIEATKNYLQDFDRLRAQSADAQELFRKMFLLHSQRANPGSLWGASVSAYSK